METPSWVALKLASEALADADGNVDLGLALKVAALIDREREACARVVEAYDPDEVWLYGEDGSYSERESVECAQPKIAAAIRARATPADTPPPPAAAAPRAPAS